jgi:hypothetical protein
MTTENQEKLILEAYRRTENRLVVQAEFAIASDQRALVLATVSVALAAVIAALSQGTDSSRLLIGSTLLLSVSSLFAILAAWPQGMKTSGSKYAELKREIESNQRYVDVVAGLCLNNDDYIDFNERRAVFRSHLYRLAIVLSALGMFLAVIGLNLGIAFPPNLPKE